MTLPANKLITVNDRGARAATTFGSVAAGGGNMVFIKKLTASSSGTLSFVDGASSVVLDNTYKEYLFTFKDIHGSAGSPFTVNFRDGDTAYDATKTTTFYYAYNKEDDSARALAYDTGFDLAQSTGTQPLNYNMGTGNDESLCGTLHLFNPSSTTFVKHFIATTNMYDGTYQQEIFVAGYCNVTAAIDGVQFKLNSGNIDAGDICLYGIL